MAYCGTWLVWGSSGWFLIVLGQCRAVLVVENNIWHKIYRTDLYNFFFSDARSFGRASDNHAEPFHRHRYQVDLKRDLIGLKTLKVNFTLLRLTLLSDEDSWPLANRIVRDIFALHLTEGKHHITSHHIDKTEKRAPRIDLWTEKSGHY